MRPTAPSRRIRTSLVMVLPCRVRWLPARAGAEVAVHPERWTPAPHRFSLDLPSFSFVILNLFQDPFHRRHGVIGSGVVLPGRSLALAARPRFSLWLCACGPWVLKQVQDDEGERVSDSLVAPTRVPWITAAAGRARRSAA